MIIVVMGVAGSGKTTIGTMLASALGCRYLEGDSLHPAANVAAMARGIPLTDADRAPWLAAIREQMVSAVEDGRDLVVGCSALKQVYRDTLSTGLPAVFIYLRGSPELIRSRLLEREDHFFEADMLDSQLDDLEEPRDALVVDVSPPPAVIVDLILKQLEARMDIREFTDIDELSERAAETAATVITAAVELRGRCALMLSGGSTPRGMHEILGSRFRDAVPWPSVHVFWSDERYVPHDDPRSNYRMARETLLDHVPCPASNIHPMPTSFDDPAEAARAHEATIREFFGDASPRFDLAVLGMGADGHTASLFPDAAELEERERWVLSVTADAEPPTRLTLTLPLLTSSDVTWFLVTGSEKAAPMARVLAGDASLPATLVQRGAGRVVWWLDREAAAQVDSMSASSSAKGGDAAD